MTNGIEDVDELLKVENAVEDENDEDGSATEEDDGEEDFRDEVECSRLEAE